MDVALNANDPAQKKRGDALFAVLVGDYDAYGLQEILWDDKKWSWKRRAEGVRKSDQEAAHESHVHVGLDVNAAQHWSESWLPKPPPSKEDIDMRIVVVDPATNSGKIAN